MLTIGDLETVAGLETWQALCGEHKACLPARRSFAKGIKAGQTLRQALESTSDDWLIWALMEFGIQMMPAFRLWLYPHALDEDTAANLYFNAVRGTLPFDASEPEIEWLRANAEHPEIEGAA